MSETINRTLLLEIRRMLLTIVGVIEKALDLPPSSRRARG